MGKQAKLKQQRRGLKAAFVDLFIEAAVPVFKETFSPDCCINGTRVALEVFQRLGMPCRPMSVDTVAMNATWWSLLQQKDNWPTEEEAADWVQRHGAWALGIDRTSNPWDQGYPGHVVLLVAGQLLDTASGQLARPAKQIWVPPMLSVSIDPTFAEGRRVLAFPVKGGNGTVVSYKASPADRTYEDAPGFRPHQINLRAAHRILDVMKSRLEQ